MHKRSKIIISVFLAVILIAAGFVISDSFAGSKETFKIGVVTPLTGPIGFIGEGVRDALVLAQEQLGDTKYKYELIFEDDANDQKLAASAANKLTSINHVDALLSLDSPSGNVVNPIATRTDVIHFGCAVDPNVAKGPNNFLHWTPAQTQAKLLTKEMKKRGVKTIGIMGSVSNPGVRVYIQEVAKAAENAGIKVVTKQIFHDGAKDFRNLLAKAKPTNPDIYVLEALTPELDILIKQMREAGMDQPLTSLECFETTKELELVEGYYYVSAVEPTSKYSDAMKKKYDKNPPVCSGNAYDVFNILVDTVEKLGKNKKPTTAAISSELLKLKDYDGALGKLYMDKSGLVISQPQLKVVKNGEFVPLYKH